MANRTRYVPHEQHPPPYQQLEPAPFYTLECGRASLHTTYSETEPLLGRSQPGPAKGHRSKFFTFIGAFLIGAFVGCVLYRSYNYDLYEHLWRRWAQEEGHRATIRAEWMEEVERYQIERIRMEKEVAEWEAERKRREERQERQRADLVWNDIHPGHCLGYATREYSGTLSNIGIGMDGLAECTNKTLNLHGRDMLPTSCNLEGPCQRVTGHWAVDFDEHSCSPSWNTISDQGCDGVMHKHRYEAHLLDVQLREDWEILCKTTPMTIHGLTYNGAMSCLDSFWGVFGTWFVDDADCD